MDKQQVLDFWFHAADSSEHMKPRAVWFEADPQFDRAVQDTLHVLQVAAATGNLNWWAEEPEGALALLILLDQAPRNIYRGSPQAFATDPLARSITSAAYANGFDRNRPAVWRWFLYMPLMHSETLIDQQRSISLFEQLRDDPDSRVAISAAHRHRDIITRFGRFPHRNAILGRESTAEELAFLREPGSAF